MKIRNTANFQKKALIEPAIPFKQTEKEAVSTDDMIVHQSCNEPTETNSATHKVTVQHFGSGTPKKWLQFAEKFKNISQGQNLQNAEEKHTLARTLLRDKALARCNHQAGTHKVDEDTNKTSKNLTNCLDKVAKGAFPLNAVAMQKQCMHRFLQK